MTGLHKFAVEELIERAMQTGKGAVLATALIEKLRERAILLPRLNATERVCAEVITRANRRIYKQLKSGQMTPADFMKFEQDRRYATLVALAVEGTATVTDEVIDLHDRIVGTLFNAAKHKHQEQFQTDGKAINDKLRLSGRVGHALLEAKQNGRDPFAAIEAIVSWEEFAASIMEAQKRVQPEDFDFLYRIGERYATLRRYAPELLNVLGLHAAPAAKPVRNAVELLREMNVNSVRKLPDDAPVEFIRERWAKLIFTDAGVDRRYYELCAFAELKKALRSGDIWVESSRQFKNFNEYMVPVQKFAALKEAGKLPLAIVADCEEYLRVRLVALQEELHRVDQLAAANDLPDAVLTDSGLKITPLDATVSRVAQNLIEQIAASLPHVKITKLLLEVDN